MIFCSVLRVDQLDRKSRPRKCDKKQTGKSWYNDIAKLKTVNRDYLHIHAVAYFLHIYGKLYSLTTLIWLETYTLSYLTLVFDKSQTGKDIVQ